VRVLAVVTGSRSDYGIYTPLLHRITADRDLHLRLMVTGMHLAPEFGSTAEAIASDGFEIDDRIESLLSSDTPEGTAKSMGLGIAGFAQAFGRERPDLLVVLGDRFEMFAATAAALPFRIPMAHIHGGELSEGSIDDALRHSMTKLSHLHFVATEEYRRRVIQMGEEEWRVKTVGALSLDNLAAYQPLARKELEELVRLDLTSAPLLVTFHPATLEPDDARDQTREVLAAIDVIPTPVVFTAPNADAQGRRIRDELSKYAASRIDASLVDNLGSRAYFSMLGIAAAMVGNSSSGIIEAASFRLPVVNIGSRQRGRVRGSNVIDSACRKVDIAAAVQLAASTAFRDGLSDLRNPYGDGHAANSILNTLRDVPLDHTLLQKHFHDMQSGPRSESK
jgi:UDP-hydrolysing UDP-N-acetyl-D-glucosamine 2-epimerase